MQKTVEKSIDLKVAVSTAYNQWTQFETFPQFMDSVTEVKQLSDDLTEWTTEVNGVSRTFTAKITEQSPDQRIAWTTLDGPKHGGVVTFHKIAENETRVMYQMDFEPEGVMETAGAALGMVERQVSSDLERFKKFIEARGSETGEWRGEISGEIS